MIQDDEELAVVQKQLARAERALESLRRRVTNERNFAVYSEGYVDQITELKAAIAAYQANKRPAEGEQRKRPRQRQKT
jgi:hypothetical protein